MKTKPKVRNKLSIWNLKLTIKNNIYKNIYSMLYH